MIFFTSFCPTLLRHKTCCWQSWNASDSCIQISYPRRSWSILDTTGRFQMLTEHHYAQFLYAFAIWSPCFQQQLHWANFSDKPEILKTSYKSTAQSGKFPYKLETLRYSRKFPKNLESFQTIQKALVFAENI